MALNWQAATGGFNDQLYAILTTFEAPTLAAGLVNRNVNLGLGFDLREGSDDLRAQVLFAMGLVDPETIGNPNARAIEQGYWNQFFIPNSTNGAFFGNSAAVLTNIMQARHDNEDPDYLAAVPVATRRTTFTSGTRVRYGKCLMKSSRSTSDG